ncbi:methyltransferase domain-containing protein, partial [Sulfurimonas sp. MAG313]
MSIARPPINDAFLKAISQHKKQDYCRAEENYLECIKYNYNVKECYHNLGIVYTHTNNLLQAEQIYLKMIELNIEVIESYVQLGDIYYAKADKEQAINMYEKALSLDSKLVEVYNNLGVMYKSIGRKKEALIKYIEGLLINEKHTLLQGNLANIIKGQTLPLVFMKQDKIENLLIVLLMSKQSESQIYMIACLGFLFHKYDLQEQKFTDENTKELLQNSLFVCLLKTTIITNFNLEYYLKKVRKDLLKDLLKNRGTSSWIDRLENFIHAFSIQCFWTEYVMLQEEYELINSLVILVEEQLYKKDKKVFLSLALCGMYKPLYSFKFINNRFIEKESIKNTNFKALYKIQVKEPKEEERLKKRMNVLKSLDDEVSKKVAHQYEENPYPRWVNMRKLEKNSLEKHFQIALPYLKNIDVDRKDKRVEILIAGSGTGKHPISVAQQVENSYLTCLDLSKTSIAYAQRKVNELGIKNINFIQGNILDLDLINKKFSYVESVGVIHHMKNPMEGWKLLEAVLEEDGYMKIGLYSELARNSVVDTLSFIKENGYQPNVKDIRQCREDIYHLESSNSMKKLSNYIDFYSVSGVRDLIFNVQEHRFSIPQIKEALKVLKLEFLGFIFNQENIYQRYFELFPEDKEAKDLDNWHIFEQQYPDTFIEMYQFLLKKISQRKESSWSQLNKLFHTQNLYELEEPVELLTIDGSLNVDKNYFSIVLNISVKQLENMQEYTNIFKRNDIIFYLIIEENINFEVDMLNVIDIS